MKYIDEFRDGALGQQGEVVEPVNFNTPEQIVIAGNRGAVRLVGR